jgi:hypothetical protein
MVWCGIADVFDARVGLTVSWVCDSTKKINDKQKLKPGRSIKVESYLRMLHRTTVYQDTCMSNASALPGSQVISTASLSCHSDSRTRETTRYCIVSRQVSSSVGSRNRNRMRVRTISRVRSSNTAQINRASTLARVEDDSKAPKDWTIHQGVKHALPACSAEPAQTPT